MVPGRETGREGGGEDGGENTSRRSRHFTANGKDHYVHPLWKILAAALALPLGGAFVGGIVSYRSGLAEVDTVVSKNPTIIRIMIDVENIDKKTDDHENRLRDLEAIKRAKGK